MQVQTRRRVKLKDAPHTIAQDLKTDFKDRDVTIFVGKGTAKTTEPFVIVFYQTLLGLIISNKLSVTDLKVLLTILDFVSLGNVVHLTHDGIAKAMDIHRPQVSKSIQKLLDCGLLLQDDTKSLFLNPIVICKQNLRSVKESKAYKIVEEVAKARGQEDQLPFA